MKTVTQGNTVKVHYTGTLTDGSVFDCSKARNQTINVSVGQGQVLPGFETALLGMTEGQTKSVTLAADEAYGETNPEAFQTVPRTAFPPDFEFSEGAIVQGEAPTGQAILAKITSVSDNGILLDYNHPLAGKDLTFEIELVEIVPESENDNE